jgi:hypothetical protein
MRKILVLAAAGLLVAATAPSFAAGKSKAAPGQMMHRYGSVAGHPGASGYAPGHLKAKKNARGASAFAPGHKKK